MIDAGAGLLTGPASTRRIGRAACKHRMPTHPCGYDNHIFCIATTCHPYHTLPSHKTQAARTEQQKGNG
eukprot:971266-Karenia_brevis.AAC.1